MKKAASILLLIFTLVQAGPLVHSFFPDQETVVFAVDEEKSPEKADTDKKKEKKDFTVPMLLGPCLTATHTSLLITDTSLPPSATAETHTPPPDFC